MEKEIKLKPIFNKLNGQINFSLKKSSLSENTKLKLKLGKLKGIKLTEDAFDFE
jgi:hypothetical protein